MGFRDKIRVLISLILGVVVVAFTDIRAIVPLHAGK